jgi:hypothetical protein
MQERNLNFYLTTRNAILRNDQKSLRSILQKIEMSTKSNLAVIVAHSYKTSHSLYSNFGIFMFCKSLT